MADDTKKGVANARMADILPPLLMTLDPDTCMYDAFINFPQSLPVMHVCMMHISMVLDLDPEACMYV